jgi:integrase
MGSPLQTFRCHGRNCEAGHPFRAETSELEERRKGAKHCTCAIWMTGSLKGINNRKTTKQTDWRLARFVADSFAAAGDWNAPPPLNLPPIPPPAPTDHPPADPNRKLIVVGDAVRKFLDSHKDEDSAEATIYKYGLELAHFEQFSKANGLVYVRDYEKDGRDWIRQVRASWDVAHSTRTTKLGVLKTFFEFCVEEKWIDSNPARLKAKRNRANRVGNLEDEDSTTGQKNPFTAEEIESMIEECRTLGRTEKRQWPKKKDGRQVVPITEYKEYKRTYTGQDLADFIHVSIHTGLRISDICMFDSSRRITRDGQVKLRATKNGNWIMMPLPEWLLERIRVRTKLHGSLIFRPTGKDIDAITNNWRRPLNDLWERCGPWTTRPTPHRFRHTFVRLLLDRRMVDPNVTLPLIATLAGDTEEMIIKHYSAWMPERQKTISEIFKTSFANIPRLG